MQFFSALLNNSGVKVLVVVIVLDTIFGILRAIKEKSINSAIGIDGIIRKVGMLICILFLNLIDYITKLNLIGFIPEVAREYIGIETIGVSTLFNLLFIIFESLSVLKNMVLCKLPIPKKLQQKMEEIFKEFTGEIKPKKLEDLHLNDFK